MNNRFKFRAWDKETKRMIEWEEINELRNLQKLMSLNFIVLIQWTGLKDKNGKEIFEGNVVKYIDESRQNQTGVIEWIDYCYRVIAINGDDEGNQDIELHPDYLSDIEIIGNIYENPNLLEND